MRTTNIIMQTERSYQSGKTYSFEILGGNLFRRDSIYRIDRWIL